MTQTPPVPHHTEYPQLFDSWPPSSSGFPLQKEWKCEHSQVKAQPTLWCAFHRDTLSASRSTREHGSSFPSVMSWGICSDSEKCLKSAFQEELGQKDWWGFNPVNLAGRVRVRGAPLRSCRSPRCVSQMGRSGASFSAYISRDLGANSTLSLPGSSF